MTPSKLRLLFFSVTILFLFCLSWLLSKNVVEHMSALHAAGLRLMVTAAALWLAATCVARKRDYPPFTKNVWLRFFLLSVFGFSLYFGSSFEALRSLKSSELAVILALIPGITYILGLMLRSVHFSWVKSIGVSVITAAAVAFNGGSQDDSIHIGGFLLALLAAASYAVYGLLSRRWLTNMALLPSLSRIVALAAVSFIPVFVLDAESLPALTGDAALKICIMGIFCSAPVYILYQKILQEGGVVYANAIGLLAPPLLFFSEFFLTREMQLDAGKILSMMGVMLGASLLFFDAAKKETSVALLARKDGDA